MASIHFVGAADAVELAGDRRSIGRTGRVVDAQHDLKERHLMSASRPEEVKNAYMVTALPWI